MCRGVGTKRKRSTGHANHVSVPSQTPHLVLRHRPRRTWTSAYCKKSQTGGVDRKTWVLLGSRVSDEGTGWVWCRWSGTSVVVRLSIRRAGETSSPSGVRGSRKRGPREPLRSGSHPYLTFRVPSSVPHPHLTTSHT